MDAVLFVFATDEFEDVGVRPKIKGDFDTERFGVHQVSSNVMSTSTPVDRTLSLKVSRSEIHRPIHARGAARWRSLSSAYLEPVSFKSPFRNVILG